MKTTLLLCVVLLGINITKAQVCPGGGVGFNNAVLFNPAWIYGCNTGTSCNGGVAFDNRSSCEPATAMDACAPAPSCGNVSNNGSDVWFKFYPGAANVVISCFQNTSLVIGIQAFSGSACGALSEIGCSLSTGPSSGTQLHLNGLNAGTLYYFRIFGSANPVSQRTGLYCFCGSTGLGNFTLLSSAATGFAGQLVASKINLSWNLTAGYANQFFDIERSNDQLSFTTLATLTEEQTAVAKTYRFIDEKPLTGENFYRIKHRYADGHTSYSNIIAVMWAEPAAFTVLSNPVNQTVQVITSNPSRFILSAISGQFLQTLNLNAGVNVIATSQLSNGVYLLQSAGTGKALKFYISR